MLCHQCGSPVGADDTMCPNCGAELKASKRLKLSESRGLRISQELKAIKLDEQHFPPGEEIAKRFVLGEMIGKGPFGEVYRARDKAIDAEVAMKIFTTDLMQSPLDEEKFLQATRAGRRLTQPNVVRLHDSGVHKDHPWVSMQLLEGLSLRKVLNLRRTKKETFGIEEVEPVVSQITLALQHVSRTFPHGDLKPENIVFLPDLIKVTDTFLLAALPAKSIIPRLEDNPYFAPELHSEKTEPSPRADVYSLGVIIGEMIFGPDYTPGSQSTGDLAGIDALVKRATAFDPRERYPTIEALSEDIATLMDTGALLGGAGAAATPPLPPPPPRDAEGSPPAPPPGPAPSDPMEEAATVEYDRDLDQRLQNSILTREVGRDFPKPVARTVTAAMPKPAGPIPAPRPVESGPPVNIILLVLVAIAFVGIMIATQQRDVSVEQIGQLPEEIGRVDAAKPAPPEKTPRDVAVEKVAQANLAANTATQAPPKHTAAQSTPVLPSPQEKDGASAPTEKVPVAVGSKPSGAKKAEKSAGTECGRGMKLVKSKKRGNYCVDVHEYPGGGVKPRTRVSWFQAKKLCEAKGKRLCKLKEWRSACGSKYPYGSTHAADKCNTADEDGFERSLAKTGSFKRCRSRRGAYDMVGNAHEWVAEQRIAGGGFESDEEVGSCRYSSPKSPASSASYIGFRCCKNPE